MFCGHDRFRLNCLQWESVLAIRMALLRCEATQAAESGVSTLFMEERWQTGKQQVIWNLCRAALGENAKCWLTQVLILGRGTLVHWCHAEMKTGRGWKTAAMRLKGKRSSLFARGRMKADTSPSWKKKRSVFDRTGRSICDECSNSGPIQKSTVPFWIPSDEKDMVPLVRPSATQVKWSGAHRAVGIFKGKWNQTGILQEKGEQRGGHHGRTQHSAVKTANKSYKGYWSS